MGRKKSTDHKEKIEKTEKVSTDTQTQKEVRNHKNKKQEETLEEKYKNLQEEYDKLKDKYLRTVAEFENFRKRSIAEKSDWIKYATENLILKICDVLDNFERALSDETKKDQFEAFKKGIELIYNQLSDIIKKEGVEKIEAIDKEFDPKFHEALAHIPSEKEENKIVAVIQNGYKMKDKVIRPVRVAVSNGQKPQKPKDKE